MILNQRKEKIPNRVLRMNCYRKIKSNFEVFNSFTGKMKAKERSMKDRNYKHRYRNEFKRTDCNLQVHNHEIQDRFTYCTITNATHTKSNRYEQWNELEN